MKLFSKGKDGGPDSTVTGWWLIEAKNLFSIVLLKFSPGSRDAFHDHAFNSVSWLLKGHLYEIMKGNKAFDGSGWVEWGKVHLPSLVPIVTKRNTFHKVWSNGTSWALSIRGPWNKVWHEVNEHGEQTLTSGRMVVNV